MHAFLTNGQKEGYEEQVSVCWHYVRYFIFANTSPQQKTSTCCAHELSDGELVLVAFKPKQEAHSMNTDANTRGNEMRLKRLNLQTWGKKTPHGNSHHRATGSLHEPYL